MTTLQKIKTIIETKAEITLIDDIQKTKYIRARAVFVTMALEHTDATLVTIGEYIGVSHASVIHYRNNVIPKYQKRDEYFTQLLNDCQDIFNNTKKTPQQNSDTLKVEMLEVQVADLKKMLLRLGRPTILRAVALPDDKFEEFKSIIRPVLLYLERK